MAFYRFFNFYARKASFFSRILKKCRFLEFKLKKLPKLTCVSCRSCFVHCSKVSHKSPTPCALFLCFFKPRWIQISLFYIKKETVKLLLVVKLRSTYFSVLYESLEYVKINDVIFNVCLNCIASLNHLCLSKKIDDT